MTLKVYVEDSYVEWVTSILTEDLGRVPTDDEIVEKIDDILLTQKEIIESQKEEAEASELQDGVDAITTESGEVIPDEDEEDAREEN